MFISLFKLGCGPQEINFVGNWLTFNIENELDYLEWGKIWRTGVFILLRRYRYRQRCRCYGILVLKVRGAFYIRRVK